MDCRKIALLFVSLHLVASARADRSLLDSSSSCKIGDHKCYCQNHKPKKYADLQSACKFYYVCFENGTSSYSECETPNLFNDEIQDCDDVFNFECEKAPSSGSSSSPGALPSPDSSSSPGTLPPPTADAPTSGSEANHTFSYAVYLESKDDPEASAAADSSISKLPKYVTHLLLSSLRPDTTYAGNVTFNGTGLEFSSDAKVIKDAIALLKEKNPNTKVLVSVGGALYNNWQALNAKAVADFVKDFGLDGVDINYEPKSSKCKLEEETVQCDTDSEYISIIGALRAALPRPYILANAAVSVGAYGEGEWKASLPMRNDTGSALNPLRKAGKEVDLLLLKSFDAGSEYSAKRALDAFANVFEGDILLGVKVAPEDIGDHVLFNSTLDSLCDYVRYEEAAGMLLSSAYRKAQRGTPTSNQISQRICKCLGLDDCDVPLVE
ncbi:hypothetical protein H632_c855p0 [Helicosporidium sp. ATCC 50920]|nr:hypothetical protein H632_c855p0 [Helicosporidium sp. ATCC 50920]|eukprot:KDD75127.1 hypothetical protein H632_c855p0 [Helicosporidium sp. ATCC 50920]